MPPQSSAPRRRSFDTFSVWALLTTIVAALVFVIPSAVTPFATTKTFLLAAGTLITLALYILARLTRGNVIFPSTALVGALWLPVAAYALSAVFSGAPLASTLWGTALEPDTLGFMLLAAVLGTLSALILRRAEHYQTFLRVGAYAFGAIALVETLVVVVGQVLPNVVSPAFSVVGSFGDLASLMGLGVVTVLIAFRFLDPSAHARRALTISGVLALFLLAVANSSLVWTLLALVSLGLFVEAVMRHGSSSADADLEGSVVVSEATLE